MPLFVKLLARPMLGPLVVATVPNVLQVRTIMQLAYFDDEAVPDEAVERYAAVLNDAAARQALVRTARQIIPPDLDSLTTRYPEIGYPTLILWGEQDAIVPLGDRPPLARGHSQRSARHSPRNRPHPARGAA